ncbi:MULTISPECIES: DUF5389 family protein [Basfia]|nr:MULTISPECIES: DUF5389 family protein [Basfia]QIM69318.1 hypothetical protein A4G13_07895 [Basfia succiniciproducens]
MDNQQDSMPEGFSKFSWAIAAFCLPVFLWPLALLVSTNLEKNPALSQQQSMSMSMFLWLYPLLLAVMARICYKLHQGSPKSAKRLLMTSAVIFYGILFYVARVGFSG